MGKTAQTARPTPPDAAANGPLLRAERLTKTFRMGDAEVQVLRDVRLAIRDGEFLAIEGRSGSGKSTLLHILGALDSPDEGSVVFANVDYTRARGDRPRRGIVGWLTRQIFLLTAAGLVLTAAIFFVLQLAATAKMAQGTMTDVPVLTPTGYLTTMWCLTAAAIFVAVPVGIAWTIRSVRSHGDDQLSAEIRNKQFGFVFQFYHLLPELDVVENTVLGQMVRFSALGYFRRRVAIRQRAKDVLTQLGMGHRLTHRPSQLSGGERQRVAIARALMNEPRILFADEPTGNLDAETGRQIMDVLEGLHRDKGQTIVMVTHDRALAREADRVMVLKAGKLETVAGE